jgi:hypothetical protein
MTETKTPNVQIKRVQAKAEGMAAWFQDNSLKTCSRTLTERNKARQMNTKRSHIKKALQKVDKLKFRKLT